MICWNLITEYANIYGNATTFDRLLGAEFTKYPIWFADYFNPSGLTKLQRLGGRNPWTLWQYEGDVDVSGNGPLDKNAFFGLKVDFDRYIETGSNLSLDIAKGKKE